MIQRFRDRLADLLHQGPEDLAVFGLADGGQRRAEQLDIVLFQDARFGQFRRQVQAGLPAQCRQQAVGPLFGDDALDKLDVQRLDIDRIGGFRVGHDRRRVGVDQHDRDAFLAQRLAGLRPGIVKLGGLPDDNRPAADDEDFLNVWISWHSLFSVSWHIQG